jgi:hypothetical protein
VRAFGIVRLPSSESPEYDWRDVAEFVPIDALLLFESLSPAAQRRHPHL